MERQNKNVAPRWRVVMGVSNPQTPQINKDAASLQTNK